MSTNKKISIVVILLVVLGLSLWAYIIEHPLPKSDGEHKKTVKTMVMKCGVGKCGAAMMEEIDVQKQEK